MLITVFRFRLKTGHNNYLRVKPGKENIMNLTVFAKKRTTKEGKPFYTYLSTLTKKDGTELTTAVKFRDECGAPRPETCPVNIIVPKDNANLSSRDFTREDTGEKSKSYTLWVSSWELDAVNPFVDHSLDDFE